MNKEEIMGILPHRNAMLLVDEAELVDENTALGRFTVPADAWFLRGHFPGTPVVPGVMLCEMLAQAACVLLGQKVQPGAATPMFTGLDKVKFRRPVRPGDTLESRCQITRSKGVFYFAQGEGRVNGELAVSCQFSFALVPNDSQ